MSRAKKSALLAMVIVIAVLSVLSIACDDGGTIDNLPRVGDALKITEAIESASCKSQGGTWSTKYNTCRK